MSRQTLFTLFKALLAAAILVAVGRQFYIDLRSPDIANIHFRAEWLVLSAALYLAGLSMWGLYWYRLLRLFDQDVTLAVAMRAYFIGQLGKYLPGKAWALWLRADQAKPGATLGVAIVTAFYEVLTSMAAGGLVAAIVFFFDPPVYYAVKFPPHFTGLILLACCGVPLLPVVFNWLATRLARRFASLETFQVPKLRLPVLLQGIALASVGWMLLGLSTWACVAALVDDLPPLTFAGWASYSAIVALAWVLGFAAFVLPGGFGMREWVLKDFLQNMLPTPMHPAIAAAVLTMRLTWTAAELMIAAVLAVVVRRRKTQESPGPYAG